MVKLIVLFILIFTSIAAKFPESTNEIALQNQCLRCHNAQQIPDELIYRRYLMVYSTSARMQEAIFAYIKNPDKKNSVMHHPFFFKFPMKEKSDIEDDLLKKMIKEYLKTFDVGNKFIISE